MPKKKTGKRKVGRPRKGTKKKQRGGALGLAASVLTPMAIEVIGTSISKRKPVTSVMRDFFR